jgi:RecB family exonuclease
MARIVRTSPFPVFPDEISEGTLVVSLGSGAPRGSHFISRSLSSIAGEILAKSGIAVAPRVHGRHMLKQAIYRVAPEADMRSLTSRLRSSLDITLRTGIDPDRLAAIGSPRVRQFGLIAAEYRRILSRSRLIDRSEMLLSASSQVSEKKKILVYGHFRARKEELELIDALAGDGSVYYLPYGDDPIFGINKYVVDQLVGRGWKPSAEEVEQTEVTVGRQAAARFANISSERAPVTALAFSDIDEEVRSTLSKVKRLIREGTAPQVIAVVARDPNIYSRPISVAADEYGIPVEIQHSIPLENTGLGGFLSILLEAIESDFSFEPTARLTMHPFGPGLGERQIAEARRKRTAGLSRWLEFCPLLALLGDKAERPLSVWSDFLWKVAETLGPRKRAVGQAAEWIAFETLFEAFRSTVRLESDRAVSFEVFAAILREILSEDSVPIRPRRGGVKVLRPEDMVGRTFDHVFVLGLAEGMFPKPPGEDPVIDLYERRVLRKEHNIRFASAADLARWEDLSFYFTLLSAQNQLVLSYPKVIDNAELVPGAFFDRLGIDGEKLEVGREADHASSVEEVRRLTLRQPVLSFDDVLDKARLNYRVELGRETEPFYDEYDGVIGVPIEPSRRSWSASQITMIGQCAFRWFAGRLLRLSSVEEMETGLDPGTRGRLYHKALEIAVSRSLDASDIRSATLKNLDEAFAEAELDEVVKLPTLPNWEVERREQLTELRKAVESPEFISPEARVVGVEREFEAEWEGFRLRGKIDRIDETSAGLIAIDYKTSGQVPKGAKDASGKLSVDVQIPIYSRVALPRLFPDGDVGTSVYYSLTKGKVLRAEQEGDMERLSDLAGFLRWILSEGSFAVDPDVQEKACTYCDFNTVCRKSPRLKRKQRTA